MYAHPKINAGPGAAMSDALTAAQERLVIRAAMERPEFASAGYLLRRSGLKSRLEASGRLLTTSEIASALDAAKFNTTDRLTVTRTLDRLGLIKG
jgi:hypothetical protein